MRFYCITTLLTAVVFSNIAWAQNFVVNGDFETDTYSASPGYSGGANPENITGWLGIGNNGINPVFAAQNPSSIVGWTKNEDSSGNIGLNPVSTADSPSPFADNGLVDGGVMLMQGIVSVYQDVSGLTVGDDYVLTVDYNSRNCCGDIPAVFLEIGGEVSDDFPDPDDFFDDTVDPVLDGAWWFTEIPFTAESETTRIEFFSSSASGGDATFLLDNIEVKADSGGDNLIVNGDFEAELDQWSVWPGYLGTSNAAPVAPFRDNGNNESQVALLQVTSSLEQQIEGLSPGQEYTLSLDFNARNCCDDFPQPQLLIDGEPLEGFPNEDGIVLPVGDDNDWYTYQTTYTADSDTLLLKIETKSELDGDSTLLLDNIFFGIPGGEMIAGDFDANGVLEVADIDALGQAIASGSNDVSFDLSADGTLSAADIDSFLVLVDKLNGDTDFSGDVGFPDFLQLSANFGQSGGEISWSGGDLDGNNAVQFPDFLILSSNFGKTSAAQAVPEPSSTGLLWIGCVGLLAWRRSRD